MTRAPTLALLACACTGSVRDHALDAAGPAADAPAAADAAADAAPGDPDAPPASGCAPLPGSGFAITVQPAAPWDGGAARVSVTGAPALTNVALTVSGTGAAPTPAWIGVAGAEPGPWTWSWSLSPLAAGDYCLVFAADPGATPYQRAALHVAADPPATAYYKVVRNHQWTCEEEYTFAINVDTTVLDEGGAPLAGVRVLVEPTTWVDGQPCELAADHPPPAEVVTGADGTVRWENYSPKCFFHERVADAPSDTAIEIYTGIWEDDGQGCNYCSTYAENVWGHWSYGVTFQRLPATEVCQVPTDHAGQATCPPTQHWEQPADPPCAPP